MSEEYTCPGCKNPIYDEEALLCHFCGESLKRPSKGALGKVRYGSKQLGLYLVAGLLLVCFLLAYIR
ncbi:MAG: hypothetical protein ACI8Q2_000666 [Candidatus Omnitrophota bacterium]|jgi:hypothetical protein